MLQIWNETHKTDLHIWKETCMKRTIHLLEFVVHRNVADMKWDPQNRHSSLKRDMYIFERRPALVECVWMHMKRDLQKRPTYLKRDLYIWKETYIHVERDLHLLDFIVHHNLFERPTKETWYIRKDTQKRDVYIWKETCIHMERDLHLLDFIVHHNLFERPTKETWYIRKDTQKRDVYIWKETCIHVEKDLQLLNFVVHHNLFERPTRETWYIRKITHQRALHIWKETYKRDLQKRGAGMYMYTRSAFVHVECVWMHMKRDPQKRPIYLKRNLHVLEFIVHHNAFERPDYHVECVWMHMKRDPQKRPTYLKRDLHLLEFIVHHNIFERSDYHVECVVLFIVPCNKCRSLFKYVGLFCRSLFICIHTLSCRKCRPLHRERKKRERRACTHTRVLYHVINILKC